MPLDAAASQGPTSSHRHSGGSPRRRRRRGRYSYLIAALSAFLGLAALLGSAFGATGGTPKAAPTPNANCTLTVPANPLSARGLATPYQLSATDPKQGPCHEADIAQSAFVQATVVDPATGALAVYNPLVIDRGTRPAAAPVRPALPANAVVGIWFGFNADTLTLRGTRGSLNAGRCVNGLGGSLFGQFAYCNAPAFFRAATSAEAAQKLVVPPLGTGKDGKPCLSTRDFGLTDQDQSDNVTTDYLATPNGRTAQHNAANATALPGAVSLLNGSDNLLLTAFVDRALGCTPYTAPDLADPGQRATSLGLDELQAARFQAAPIALVPVNDPMAQVDGKTSRAKTNLYRAGVDMPRLNGVDQGSAPAYCTQLATTGTQRINDDKQLFTAAVSPDAGTDLFAFLTARLAASLTNLNCPAASTSATPSATSSASSTASATASPTATVTATATGTATATATATGTVPPTSQPATAPATMPPPVTTASPTPSSMIGVPATSPVPVAAPSGTGTVVQVHDPAPAPSSTAAVSAGPMAPSTIPAVAAPVASSPVLAETGARGSAMPYVGLAVSLLLFGFSAFLLVGRREPVRRPR